MTGKISLSAGFGSTENLPKRILQLNTKKKYIHYLLSEVADVGVKLSIEFDIAV